MTIAVLKILSWQTGEKFSALMTLFSIFFFRESMPCRFFFSPGEKSLDFVQQRFGHVKPYPAEDKYYKKKDRDCSYFSQSHILPHFVANRFIKKSVNAASSSSWDTYTYRLSSSSQSYALIPIYPLSLIHICGAVYIHICARISQLHKTGPYG